MLSWFLHKYFLPHHFPSPHSKGFSLAIIVKWPLSGASLPLAIGGRRVFGAFPALLGQLPGPCSQDTSDWGSPLRGVLPGPQQGASGTWLRIALKRQVDGRAPWTSRWVGRSTRGWEMPRHPPHRRDWKQWEAYTSSHNAQLLTLFSSGDKADRASISSAPAPKIPQTQLWIWPHRPLKVVLAMLFSSQQHILYWGPSCGWHPGCFTRGVFWQSSSGLEGSLHLPFY